jgi:hypothetical protein
MSLSFRASFTRLRTAVETMEAMVEVSEPSWEKLVSYKLF